MNGEIYTLLNVAYRIFLPRVTFSILICYNHKNKQLIVLKKEAGSWM